MTTYLSDQRNTKGRLPFGNLPLQHINDIIALAKLRVALIWALNRPQRGPYTGRGARTVGLISDRTRNGLQHPLRREDFSGQTLFRHRRLIEGFGQRLEDGFHDVVWVAAVHQIDVQIEPAMGDKGLKEILEEP